MATIDEIKQLAVTETPLFLFECTLVDGTVERWSTHQVTVDGHAYPARILQHNLFEWRANSDDGTDSSARVSVTLANADSYFSQLERSIGWKGAKLTARFVFMNLATGAAATESRVLFRGVANPPDEITESALRLSFTNRLNLQRVSLPEVRISRRCPWMFPSSSGQRQEALSGGAKGKFSALSRCGYSAGETGGRGNLNGGVAYTSCDYSRAACTARGMFDRDSTGAVTRRFGGVEFVPASVAVRSYGESGSHLSPVIDNEAKYNDYVALVYGTGWYQPPVVMGRNDGNLTRIEVLLGMGEIKGVIKVLVNDIEIPEGQSGANMTATGWYNVVSPGTRGGAFNADFQDASGNSLGDPYGSMAYLSVVVPNRVQNGSSNPKIQVLLEGLKVAGYDAAGAALGETFTNNPAWVLLDVLRRSGWAESEIDLSSFARTAAYCEEAISSTDLNGNATSIPRHQCNLVIQKRRSAAELVRGIRSGAGLLLTYGNGGLLQLKAEGTLAVQQPAKPAGSNAIAALAGGWPAYEFSDGSAAFSGILRKNNGAPTLRLRSRSAAESPNRYSVEFQDQYNAYQQDSLSLVDAEDLARGGQELSTTLTALGIPNFDQATRMVALALDKSIRGNTYAEFETSVRGIGLAPGDLISLTYAKEGLVRQPMRVVKVAPASNYQTVTITTQWHDDAWYPPGGADSAGGRRSAVSNVGIPRPLVGDVLDEDGVAQFSVSETSLISADGTYAVRLAVGFVPPEKPGASAAHIPLASLTPVVQTSGGSLKGGPTLYYAVSAVDADGSESRLSFTVKAKIPAGTDTNSVVLQNLSFSAGTASFRVYRGPSPTQLLRIASGVAVAGQFTDLGATAPQLAGPPDENFNHANFYWRLELQPGQTVNTHSTTTVGNSTLNMLSNDFRGAMVRVSKGKGVGQERTILSNSGTTLTVRPAWDVEPDGSSKFAIAESSWKFGAISEVSPVEFDVPNRKDATVQISGRSANAHDKECAAELCPLTRWRIGGAAGSAVDTDVPAIPTFGLSPAGQGTVDLVSVSFVDLRQTRTISGGTLSLYFWDETNSPSQKALAADLTAASTTLSLNSAGTAVAGDLIQVDAEVMAVASVQSGGLQYTVARGSHATTAVAHSSGGKLYDLARNVSIVPFVKDFFGSQASGSYSHPIFLPDVRIAAAEFFVTNTRGSSGVKRVNFTSFSDLGLRTLSGGQMSIQVEGYLAIQDEAAPPILIEDTHSVRDVYAVAGSAPSGGAITLQLKVDGNDYCALTIADGSTTSNVVNGFGKAPLAAGAKLTLNITGVPQSAGSLPGSDLTVIVRL